MTLTTAGILIITDARRDVYSGGGHPFRVRFPDADITKAEVTNTGQNVAIRLKFAGPIGAKSGHNGGIEIRTNTGLDRNIDFIFSRHIGTLTLNRDVDIPTHCPVRLDKEYAKGIIGFTVPRSCLHNPRWVRVNIAHDRQGHGPRGRQFDYWDTPHNNQPGSHALSPRVIYAATLPAGTKPMY